MQMQGTIEHGTVHLDHIWYWFIVKYGVKRMAWLRLVELGLSPPKTKKTSVSTSANYAAPFS